jgi:hypothetical protein
VMGAAALVTTLPSHAMPAFARATQKACTSCHFQHFPILNEMGTDFKASGYTDMKNKPLAGKDLSIADSLYASLFSKIRYQKSNGSDTAVDSNGNTIRTTNSGEIQFPDEFAVLLGGRISKNIGFMLEGNLIAGGASVLAGFKMPMMYELSDGLKGGVVPFATDALGASYGFELMNTGAVRNVRVSEHRKETSAQQYVFFDSAGAATGFSFVLHHPQFHVALTPYTPEHAMGGGNRGLDARYLRAVYTPTIAGWATGFGLQQWSGNNVRAGAANAIEIVSANGTSLDAQAQGDVGGMPLGLYFATSKAPGSTASTPSLFNAKPNARKATTLTAELGVLPQKATVLLAIRRANNGAATGDASDNAITLGGTYQLAQNVQLQMNRSSNSRASYSGGKSMTTFMLAVGY